jgi:hypothetical protein
MIRGAALISSGGFLQQDRAGARDKIARIGNEWFGNDRRQLQSRTGSTLRVA